MEKKSSFFQLLYKTQVPGIQKKTSNIKIVKINLFLSYEERTKHNVVIFSIIYITGINKLKVKNISIILF